MNSYLLLTAELCLMINCALLIAGEPSYDISYKHINIILFHFNELTT